MPQLLIAGETPLNAELDQWWTPLSVAREIAEWIAPHIKKGDKVLEPSAGTGRLVDALLAAVDPALRIHCVDFDRENVLKLGYKYQPNVTAQVGDFLADGVAEDRPTFAWTVMNPPFSINRLDAYSRHIAKAMRLSVNVAFLAPAAAFHSRQRHERIWSLVEAGSWYIRGHGAFKRRPQFVGSGGSREVCVIWLSREVGAMEWKWFEG